MLLVLGNKDKSTTSCTYTCEGCKDQVKVDIDWYSGYTWEDAHKAILDMGWHRRCFTEGVDPWFCSEKCAMESPQALEWEKYWKSK